MGAQLIDYCLSVTTLTRTEAAARTAAISELTYAVHLDLTDAASDTATFPSTCTATFRTKESSVFLDLIAADVLAVEVNGQSADARIVPGRIYLDNLPTDAPVQVKIMAHCEYSRTGEGLHRYRDPEDGQTYLYTQYEPMDAHRVYACFDQPDLKAHWTFTVDAPADWTVLSNQHEVAGEDLMPAARRHNFAPTELLSSYITCIIAGPYHRVTGPTWQGTCPAYHGGPERSISIELAAYCRAALADRFDSDDIFEVTMAGFDFFHDRYQFAYPWGSKYDQVFVPEYNLGAMENPGCVTFNEHYIPQGKPSIAERSSRGNTILHEMCHMWFGDLVTPRWWDDLWLKESFADHEGTAALGAATRYTDAWAVFAAGRKAWAYQQDQLPTTHPIAADIPDVAAAKQNFDGITYAKGAAVLKQLVAFLGEDTFVDTARRYFADHAFSSTTAADLLSALGQASGRDMQQWTQLWLHTSGPSTIGFDRAELALTQESHDAVSGEETLRPHRLSVGSYAYDDGFTRLALDSVELAGASLRLPHLPQADAYLINDDDHTYAVIQLDDASREVFLAHLSELADPLARAVVWSSLWNDVRAGRLAPRHFIDAVLTHGGGEEQSVLRALLNQVTIAWRRYSTRAQRDDLLPHIQQALAAQVQAESEPGMHRLWALAYARAAADSPPKDDALVRVLMDSDARDVRWAAIIAQAAAGQLTGDEIETLQQRDNSGFAAVMAAQATASLPDAGHLRSVWDRIFFDAEISNEMLDALLAGFATSAAHSNVPQAEEYCERIAAAWQARSIGMGIRIATEAFPAAADISEVPAEDVTSHPTVVLTDRWLAEHPDPPALRRCIVEGRDQLVRALRIQAKHGRAGV